MARSLCSTKFPVRFPKDVKGEYPSSYDSRKVEAGWYDWWDINGFFEASGGSGKVFSMVLPPPNVTGHLHLGHALTVTVEDALVRWQRMKGRKTLWVPGSDHAGIATQVVVEKWLKNSKNINRQDIGREEFLKYVWQWRDTKGDVIFDQLQRLGASLDWTRTAFTMSKSHSRAVDEAFVRLFNEGLIYRGHRLVNWSPALASAISDIEVDHIDIEAGKRPYSLPQGQKATVGLIYDVAFPVKGQKGQEVIVSTTRPETILGDTAVAVHPLDDRYSRLINEGHRLVNPFRNDLIPLVTDGEQVDPSFGTGAVKVTPGHDHSDFIIGQNSRLPTLTVIDKGGNMTFICHDEGQGQSLNDLGQTFMGLPRFKARPLVVEALEKAGLLRGIRDHAMTLPVCSRTGDIVEPLVQPQWFLKASDLARSALDLADSGSLTFCPEQYKRVWKTWLDSSRDWCISRQLWWGHTLPVWSLKAKGQTMPLKGQGMHVEDADGTIWICGRSDEEAMQKATELTALSPDKIDLCREEDVLDTWFSSALIPFANFGWPEQTTELEMFYPLSLMETGHDILFFWVARMVMLGYKLTGQLPFKEVLLHGIICDGHGRKMSKSLGNVIDPLHLVNGITLQDLEQEIKAGNLSKKDETKAIATLKKEYPQGIAAYGADALRFGLCANDLKSGLINLDLQIIKTSAAFCNKIWQAVRFLRLSENNRPSNDPLNINLDYLMANKGQLRPEDLWILAQCAEVVKSAESHLENRDFHLLTRSLRQFLYSCLCDVYLEAVKPHLSREHFSTVSFSTLYTVVSTGLQLLHPLMPYITEELYQRLPENHARTDLSIMTSRFPMHKQWEIFHNEAIMKDMEVVLAIVKAARNTKSLYSLNRSDLPELRVVGRPLEHCGDLIRTLVPCGPVTFCSEAFDKDEWSQQRLPEANEVAVFVKLDGMIDVAKEKERVEQKRSKLTSQMDKLKAKTAKVSYEKVTRSEDKRRDNTKMQNIQDELALLCDQEELLNTLSKKTS